MRPGAACSIRRRCRSARSWNTPRGCSRRIEINGSFYSLQSPSSWQLARRDAGRFRLRREGPALHHPHPAAARRAILRSRTSSPPACCCCARSSGRCCGSSRRTSGSTVSASQASSRMLPRTMADAVALARRHDPTACAGAHAWPEVDRRRSRCGMRVEIRHASFVDPGLHRAAARARHRPGRRRHRRQVAVAGGRDRRLRLHPPAWRRGALRQRLQRTARSTTGPRASAPTPTQAATCTATSTTT